MMKGSGRPPIAPLLIWLGLAAGSVVGYLLLALMVTSLGFPLDDAWIHQVFARNLAQRGEFSYNPGQPVAGSTSPLWTVLLVPGYAFEGFYIFWTYGLGILFLALTAHEAFRLTRQLTGNSRIAWGAGLLTLFDWRLTWAGASGMETILFTFGSLFLVRFYLEKSSKINLNLPQSGRDPQTSAHRGQKPAPTRQSSVLSPQSSVLLGLFGGLLTLVRPEGSVLLALVALDFGWRRRGEWRELAQGWGLLIGGWVVVALPYFLFNYALSGSFLPNTFGAKVSGYSDLSPEGLLRYLGNGLSQFFLGSALFVLIPGLLFCLKAFRQGSLDWRPLVWPPVVFVLYALRLPVLYQHARYLIPLTPFFIIYGVIGTAGLVGLLRTRRFYTVARLVPVVIGLAVGLIWYIGAIAYQKDVKIINVEQVQVGRWLAANTLPTATVATHDIGAITYFGKRKLVDTAGLVSPEFVPIVRDQPKILAKLVELKVDYFALLPTWYPELYPDLEKTRPKVFQPQEPVLEEYGEKDMAVYKLR